MAPAERHYSGETTRAQLLLDLVEFYATTFRPKEHCIRHEPGTNKIYFARRQADLRPDLEVVLSNLRPQYNGDEDFCDSPVAWGGVIKPFFQKIADGIRQGKCSSEHAQLLGIGRPTKEQRRREAKQHEQAAEQVREQVLPEQQQAQRQQHATELASAVELARVIRRGSIKSRAPSIWPIARRSKAARRSTWRHSRPGRRTP